MPKKPTYEDLEKRVKQLELAETEAKALLQERETAQRYLDIAGVMLAAMNRQGEITLMNKKGHQILGYPEGELIGKNWFEVCLPKRNQAEIKEVFRRQMSGGFKPLEFYENTILQRSGEERIIAFHNTLLYDKDGISGVLFSGEDITKRKSTEEALKKHQKLFKEVESIGKVGGWEINVDSGEYLCTDEVYHIHEISTNSPLGVDDGINYYTPDSRLIIAAAVQQAIEQRRPFEVELEIITAKGNLRAVHSIGKPDLENRRIYGFFQDITERKQAEQKRQELEQQLSQKHKMEAVGFMAGGMAHNFNNNLSIILGNLELAQMKQQPDNEVSKYLQHAKIGVRRSRDLVQKIITYSRQGIIHKAPMHLTTIIDETLGLLQSTLPSTINLQHNYRPDSHTRLIDADPSQIQEVLINLCNNAVQAMDETGDLTISLEPVVLKQQDILEQYDCFPGPYSKLSVQDTGCGIPPDILDKIFDPFYSTKEEYEGAGMGLATVQGIVAQHGGMIKVDSVPHQGTTFEIYMPLLIDTSLEEEPFEERRAFQRGTEHILFVDDDERLATLGEQLLSALGYQISMMTDSAEALKMFTANADRVDLVITDQTMPNLTGKDLIAEVKKIRVDIPSILCTGYSSKVDEDEAAKLGISAFMMKPLDLLQLSETVRQVLDGDKEI